MRMLVSISKELMSMERTFVQLIESTKSSIDLICIVAKVLRNISVPVNKNVDSIKKSYLLQLCLFLPSISTQLSFAIAFDIAVIGGNSYSVSLGRQELCVQLNEYSK